MTSNREQRLERLRVDSVLACDRAIDALTQYRTEALLLNELSDDEEYFRSQINKINSAIDDLPEDENRTREGVRIYERCHKLRNELRDDDHSDDLRDLFVSVTRRLVVEAFGVDGTQIDDNLILGKKGGDVDA